MYLCAVWWAEWWSWGVTGKLVCTGPLEVVDLQILWASSGTGAKNSRACSECWEGEGGVGVYLLLTCREAAKSARAERGTLVLPLAGGVLLTLRQGIARCLIEHYYFPYVKWKPSMYPRCQCKEKPRYTGAGLRSIKREISRFQFSTVGWYNFTSFGHHFTTCMHRHKRRPEAGLI